VDGLFNHRKKRIDRFNDTWLIRGICQHEKPSMKAYALTAVNATDSMNNKWLKLSVLALIILSGDPHLIGGLVAGVMCALIFERI